MTDWPTEPIDGDFISSADSVSDNALDVSNSRESSTATTKEEEMKLELAKRETVTVTRLRILVFVILLCAAISVSLVVYYIMLEAEKQESESQYEMAADKVLEEFVDGTKVRLGAVASLAVAAVAHGVDHAIGWPFVTLSSFQARATSAREQSQSVKLIHINPIVDESDKHSWETFVTRSNERLWIDEAERYQEAVGLFDFLSNEDKNRLLNQQIKEDQELRNSTVLPIWYHNSSTGERIIDKGPGPYFPTWQSSPVFRGGHEVNENVDRSTLDFRKSYQRSSAIIGSFFSHPPGWIDSTNYGSAFLALLISTRHQRKITYEGDPFSKILFPVFDSFRNDRKVVAVLTAWIHWSCYFGRNLPQSMRGIILVLKDSCGGDYTFEVNGAQVTNIGAGDHHNRKYNELKRSASFVSIHAISDGTTQGVHLDQTECPVSLEVYPSDEFFNTFMTTMPLVVTFAVAFVFVFTAFMFWCYDRIVERRQAIVLLRAEQTTRIVTSLFPQRVADRMIQAANNDEKLNMTSGFSAPNRRLKTFLTDSPGDGNTGSQPIADLFPNCSVLFADIAGFTAWSSTRDPEQVFILLQTIYQAFDTIAKRRKVFKVETIGDSYVAVTGLPDPQDAHAIIMARFAGECLAKINQLTAELESTLGPDTADLSMRFGIHSGPVTAGVLQGDRARFQLFGDTVNTAARMESTGLKNKIQVSQATHDLLVKAGKAHWLRPRTEIVEAKGKGVVQTYWLVPSSRKASASSVSASSTSGGLGEGGFSDDAGTTGDGNTHSIERKGPETHDEWGFVQSSTIKTKKGTRTMAEALLKRDRLVDWVTDILREHIKTLIALRRSNRPLSTSAVVYKAKAMKTPLDEVAEVIHLPRYNSKAFESIRDRGEIEIDEAASKQLHQYVSIVASTYRDNHFHNFEHACHVTMAVNKFIKRIVCPDLLDNANGDEQHVDIASKLHEYTHGITSDPLTVLGIVFSALIHDADHRGVSNIQLMQEQKEMAAMYRNKSVAEQNSVDISWDLLMADQFKELRAVLFSSPDELNRFRQVIVNVVLATDIFDKELGELRTKRWNKAFVAENANCSHNKEWNDMRATIVMEHIIQASDVAHTMQHWHVYRKWNKRLLLEMYAAYRSGRIATDPTTFWYHGELGFFDSYVLPLARKLKDCHVFGVSSDECLNYAMENRAEWADRGEALIEEVQHELVELYGPAQSGSQRPLPS